MKQKEAISLLERPHRNRPKLAKVSGAMPTEAEATPSTQMASFVLLEDDVLVAQELCEGLKESGFKHLGSFISGEDLLKVVDKLQPDILLVDIGLAGTLDGIQTVTALSTSLPSRVIFLTGNDDEDTLRRAMVLRPHAYLLKPLEVSAVRASILVTLSRNPTFESELQSELHAELKAPHSVAAEGRDPGRLMLGFPQYAPLGAELLAKLTGRAILHEGKAGTFLMRQGDSATTAFVMLSGMAMCSRQEADGRELTVHVASPGDPVGLVLTLEPLQKNLSIRLPFDARYIAIPSSDVKMTQAESTLFAQMLLQVTASFTAEVCDLAVMLAYTKVEIRILRILEKLLRSIGKPMGSVARGASMLDNSVRIFLTRKELADLTGTTVESAIRATKIWERRGILDLSRPGIIVIPSRVKLSEAIHGDV